MSMAYRVAFPMYVLPEVQADMRALWTRLHSQLRGRLELPGLPDAPEFEDPLADGGIPDELLLWQYCGYPYVTRWHGRIQPLACLHYDAPHCEGGRHRSVIILRKGAGAQSIAEMRGCRAAINGHDSNTGMNLLRHAVAPYAEEGRFFGGIIETGAHIESLRAVAQGRADMASIDCVTFAYIGDYLPELASKVRVLGVTASSPSLPLFTRADAPESQRAAIYRAWEDVFADPAAKALLARLRLRGISPVTADELAVISSYAQMAVEQGYPVLR